MQEKMTFPMYLRLIPSLLKKLNNILHLYSPLLSLPLFDSLIPTNFLTNLCIMSAMLTDSAEYLLTFDKNVSANEGMMTSKRESVASLISALCCLWGKRKGKGEGDGNIGLLSSASKQYKTIFCHAK